MWWPPPVRQVLDSTSARNIDFNRLSVFASVVTASGGGVSFFGFEGRRCPQPGNPHHQKMNTSSSRNVAKRVPQVHQQKTNI